MVYSKRLYWVFDNGTGGAVFIAALLNYHTMLPTITEFSLPAAGSTERTLITESLQQLHQFLDRFSAEDIQTLSWELLSCAIGSEEADTWTPFERSKMLFFYTELSKLSKALPALDKHLGPMFL